MQPPLPSRIWGFLGYKLRKNDEKMKKKKEYNGMQKRNRNFATFNLIKFSQNFLVTQAKRETGEICNK